MTVSKFLEGFEEYSQDNWDGEGAHPIAAETIEVARSILSKTSELEYPEADVAPGFNGTIGLVWENPSASFYSYLTIRDCKNAKLYIRTAGLNEDKWLTGATPDDLVKIVLELLGGLKTPKPPKSENKVWDNSFTVFEFNYNIQGTYPSDSADSIALPSGFPEYISLLPEKTGTDN